MRPKRLRRLIGRAAVPAVVCEEKHMGSRAVLVGVPRRCGGGAGALRRGGRHRRASAYNAHRPAFFNDATLEETSCSPGVRSLIDGAGLWESTVDRIGGVVSTRELMPWSAKAQELIFAVSTRRGCQRRSWRGSGGECARARGSRRPAGAAWTLLAVR